MTEVKEEAPAKYINVTRQQFNEGYLRTRGVIATRWPYSLARDVIETKDAVVFNPAWIEWRRKQ